MCATVCQMQRLVNRLNENRPYKLALNEPVVGYHIAILLFQSFCYAACLWWIFFGTKWLYYSSEIIFFTIDGILNVLLCCIIARLVHTDKTVALIHTDLHVDFEFNSDVDSSQSEQDLVHEVDSD
jgi:hypothetical protein